MGDRRPLLVLYALGRWQNGQKDVLLFSDQANGTTGFQEALIAFHGKPIRDAQHPDWRPGSGHLDWHGRELFKGEARHTNVS